MARISRGAPRSSRASIATPSDTAARSALGCTCVGCGPTAGGGADEQLTAATHAIPDTTRPLTRDIAAPPAVHSTVSLQKPHTLNPCLRRARIHQKIGSGAPLAMSDAMSDAVITAFDAHDAMSDIDSRQPECFAGRPDGQ